MKKVAIISSLLLLSAPCFAIERTINLKEKFECYVNPKKGYRKIDDLTIAVDGSTVMTTIAFEGEGFDLGGEKDFSIGPIYTKYVDHGKYFRHLYGKELADEDHSDENIIGYLNTASKDDPAVGNCRKVGAIGAKIDTKIKDDARAAEVDTFIDTDFDETKTNTGTEVKIFD